MGELIRVRSTVTLVGLAAGEEVWADKSDPQVQRWLRGGHLIALDPEPAAKVEVETPVVQPLDPQAPGETHAEEPVTRKPPGAKKQ